MPEPRVVRLTPAGQRGLAHSFGPTQISSHAPDSADLSLRASYDQEQQRQRYARSATLRHYCRMGQLALAGG